MMKDSEVITGAIRPLKQPIRIAIRLLMMVYLIIYVRKMMSASGSHGINVFALIA